MASNHSNEPRINCNLCDSSFISSEDMDDHVKAHHLTDAPTRQSTGMFECNICEYTTSRYTDLWKHKMNHNGSPLLDIDQEDVFFYHMNE